MPVCMQSSVQCGSSKSIAALVEIVNTEHVCLEARWLMRGFTQCLCGDFVSLRIVSRVGNFLA